jgi:hypothetical protein
VVEMKVCFYLRLFIHETEPMVNGCSRAYPERVLRRRESSSQRMMAPERRAATKAGCRREGQELEGMECGEEGVPRLISRERDRRSFWDVAGGPLLPAAGQGCRARSLWRAKMEFLASWDALGTGGERESDRDQTHSGQMGPPAKKLAW